MSLEKALAENTAALNKLCELMSKSQLGPLPLLGDRPEGISIKEGEEPKPALKVVKDKKAPEPVEEIELPGKTYAEDAAEAETDEFIEEPLEQEKPTITEEELIQKFREFAGVNRKGAIELLAKFGVPKLLTDDKKPAIPQELWSEFAEQCHVNA